MNTDASEVVAYKGLLSLAQIAEGMNAAIRNATRLAADANALLEGGSFPTAASLAALSIEESGKVTILRRLVTERDVDGVRVVWKDYRSHTKKNSMWIIGQLVSEGARKVEDFRKIVDPGSDHMKLLDSVKQLGFYTDCLNAAHWSEPVDVVDEGLARTLVATARAVASKRPVTVRELELWARHWRPAGQRSLAEMKASVTHWYADMQTEGLAPKGPNMMASFLSEGLTIPQADAFLRSSSGAGEDGLP